MDKQEQIEEMAKGMCEHCIENEEFTCSIVHQPCVFAKTFAETLYNAGYRKIPENAVVLTDDEYERWQGQTLNIKKVRKETAEKFKKLLKALVAERNFNEDYDWEDVQVDGQIFVECVDEICKEITEGMV